ncbi:MAG: hypothetical protein E6Q76_11470 [Rhizobium sp.]|nr:MAG: hypothetical protein E6Q76_11470 [Rhizobium sp.]
MKFRSTIGAAGLGLVLAVAPVGGTIGVFVPTAFAKGGNSNGNGGGHGAGKSDHDKSERSDAGSTSANTAATQGTSSSLWAHHAGKHAAAHGASARMHVSKPDIAHLGSLKRDYHAYLNARGPKMAALAAYVKAYAEFEQQYGTTAVPTDPSLSDNALRSALAQLSNRPVTDRMLAEAKKVLGVGADSGKIAEVRNALARKPDTSTPPTSTATIE